MALVPPERRAKRKSWVKWRDRHLWDECALCGESPGVLWSRYKELSGSMLIARMYHNLHGYQVPVGLLHSRVVSFMRSVGFDVTKSFGDVDHKVPLWEGGEDAESNLQILCQPCHKNKSNEEARRRSRAPTKVFRRNW